MCGGGGECWNVESLAIGPCSLLDADVEMNSEQLLRKKFSQGEVVNGVVEQVRHTHTLTLTHTHTHTYTHSHTHTNTHTHTHTSHTYHTHTHTHVHAHTLSIHHIDLTTGAEQWSPDPSLSKM